MSLYHNGKKVVENTWYALDKSKYGTPIEIETSVQMDIVLTSENIGKIFVYVGETNDKYTNGNYYLVVEEV